MAEPSSRARETEAVHAFRFGAFDMDIRSGELRRHGRLVRLQPQPFKVLALLVGRSGEVVTREEIQAQIWPVGTFVDFEQSLNFCIRQIRAALGDSAAHPRFVETLPRRGYRWVGGPVEQVPPPVTLREWPRRVPADPTNGDNPAGAVSPPAEGREPRRRTVIVALAGAALLLGALAFAYRLGGLPSVGGTRPDFQRITYHRGAVTSARFGPDRGVVYVASWEGRPWEMQLLSAGARESRPLRTEDVRIVAASDSEVAFLREGVLARAPLAGGPPREVAKGVLAADWTRDTSEFAVVRAHAGRFHLEYPVGRALGRTQLVSQLRLSPDGGKLALAEHPILGDDRGRAVIVGEDGERLAESGPWGSLEGIAWSPRGGEVWFTAAREGAECQLRALSLDGRVRVIHVGTGRLVLHDVEPDGRVLLERTVLRGEAFFRRRGDDGDRGLSWLDVSGVEGMSDDASRVLLVESGDGGGPDYTSYLRETDGSLPVRLGPGRATSLSPDGKWALLIPVRDPDHVEIVPTDPGPSRRVRVPGAATHDTTGWLPDGRSFYVTTRDSGGRRTSWIFDLSGGEPRPLPLPEGIALYFDTFSPDGRRFVARCPESRAHCVYETDAINPRPLAGAEPDWRPVTWGQRDGIYFRDRSQKIPEVLWRVDLRTGGRERVAEIVPADPSGVLGLTRVMVARSGEAWAYSLVRRLSDLYVVTGLR